MLKRAPLKKGRLNFNEIEALINYYKGASDTECKMLVASEK